jgi:hypothetical protein
MYMALAVLGGIQDGDNGVVHLIILMFTGVLADGELLGGIEFS